MSTQDLPYREPPPRNLQVQGKEYTTPLSNTTTSTQEVRHKTKNNNHLYTRGIGTKPNQRRVTILVITKITNNFFSQKQDLIDRIDMIAQV